MNKVEITVNGEWVASALISEDDQAVLERVFEALSDTGYPGKPNNKQEEENE